MTCVSVWASERAEGVRMRRNRVRRSRRPRRMRACGADATRIHHAGMKRPAVGAAFAERWSERGSGVRHGSVCRQLQDYVLVRRASRFSGETFKAVDGGVTTGKTAAPCHPMATLCGSRLPTDHTVAGTIVSFRLQSRKPLMKVLKPRDRTKRVDQRPGRK